MNVKKLFFYILVISVKIQDQWVNGKNLQVIIEEGCTLWTYTHKRAYYCMLEHAHTTL